MICPRCGEPMRSLPTHREGWPPEWHCDGCDLYSGEILASLPLPAQNAIIGPNDMKRRLGLPVD